MMQIRVLGMTVWLLAASATAMSPSNLSTISQPINPDLSSFQSEGSVDERRSPFLWPYQERMFGLEALVAQPASAQPLPLRRINHAQLSEQVYQQLPDFPRENQYLSSETGEIATENTLASRIIRYHMYSQERPTNFRLDWKLTLADYLGAFERMRPDDYPDYGLQENPMAADIAVIESLTPEMRDRLVNTLYETLTATP